ncbi:probable spastin homolog spas-1 [Thrips palmi]|uniref:Probable spastin homolog spas-1 n=1 Tax=Thrips palmi TaxID=161013 RepID=A0A6P8ZQT8_THRPL|nr:probable spastin homolog spas-1 [Thrips palmi]
MQGNFRQQPPRRPFFPGARVPWRPQGPCYPPPPQPHLYGFPPHVFPYPRPYGDFAPRPFARGPSRLSLSQRSQTATPPPVTSSHTTTSVISPFKSAPVQGTATASSASVLTSTISTTSQMTAVSVPSTSAPVSSVISPSKSDPVQTTATATSANVLATTSHVTAVSILSTSAPVQAKPGRVYTTSKTSAVSCSTAQSMESRVTRSRSQATTNLAQSSPIIIDDDDDDGPPSPSLPSDTESDFWSSLKRRTSALRKDIAKGSGDSEYDPEDDLLATFPKDSNSRKNKNALKKVTKDSGAAGRSTRKRTEESTDKPNRKKSKTVTAEKKCEKPLSDDDDFQSLILDIPLIKKGPVTHDSLVQQVIDYHRPGECEEKYVRKVLGNLFDSAKVRWADICGLRAVKQRLKEMVVYPLLNPLLFKGLRRPGKGLLLYGPPGTGKTMIGKCLATEGNATFFSITTSTFGAKYYGEAESIAKALFQCASALQPSIIFIDEVDAVLHKPNDIDSSVVTRLKTELLSRMDGCSSKADDRILVVGATNWPYQIDEAARRRFTKRLYIPLPDAEGRKEQCKRLLRGESHNLTEDDFDCIADMTEGYSGCDIKAICEDAAMAAIRMIDDTEVSVRLLEEKDLSPISLADFQDAISRVSKSVSPELLLSLQKFSEEFGTQ